MNFPCTVFDSEVLLSDHDTAAVCSLAAVAGCSLEELWAWASFARIALGEGIKMEDA